VKFDARLFPNLSYSCHRRRFAFEHATGWNLCSGLRVIAMVEDKKLALSLNVDHNPLPWHHAAILGRRRGWSRVVECLLTLSPQEHAAVTGAGDCPSHRSTRHIGLLAEYPHLAEQFGLDRTA